MNPTPALLPCAVFPPWAWFQWANHPESRVCVHEHFVKQSLRNRVALAGARGPFDLSLPVHRRHADSRCIADIRFTDRVNPGLLLKPLQTNCGSAPFFEHYFPEVVAWAEVHLRPNHALVDAALASTEWACGLLGMPHPLLTTTYEAAATGMRDCRPKVAWRGLETPRYPQVFEDRLGFVHNRSILDVVFHLGPETSTLPSRHGNTPPPANRPA